MKRLFIIIYVILFFLLTGCSENTTNEDLYEKIMQEVNYLDTKILKIANELNGIYTENFMVQTEEVNKPNSSSTSKSEQQKEGENKEENKENSENESKNENENENQKSEISYMKTTSILANESAKPNWKNTKEEIELLYNTWNTIIVDLYKLQVPTDTVSQFTNSMNELTISIIEENKEKTIDNASKLYSYLPLFLEHIPSKENEFNLRKTKEHVLNAYSFTQSDNWENTEKEISFAIDTFNNVLKDAEYINKREYKFNRIYVMLDTIKNCLLSQNKNIFFINYKNLINELSI